MGKLLLDQRSESGRALAALGTIAAGLMLVWVVMARETAVLPWTLIPVALAGAGVYLGLSGHRIFEHGVEVFSPRGAVAIACADVASGEAKRVAFRMHGIHTRTTYHVR